MLSSPLPLGLVVALLLQGAPNLGYGAPAQDGSRERPAGVIEADEPDPEATPKGRRTYLGRTVARTMSWQGAPWLMRDSREQEENGKQLRAWLDVQPGDRVADFGCGNGYHTLPLARSVGQNGLVYAVDLQPEMLDLLAQQAQELSSDSEGELLIEPRLAKIDDPNLPADSCDFVLMVDVYHELSHPVRVIKGIRRSLRKGGVLVLVEYRSEDKSVPIKLLHKMSKAQVIAEMAANGLTLAAETNDLPWQHAMAFESAPQDVGKAEVEARAMANGFLDAVHLGDPRVVFPFLGSELRLDSDSVLTGGKAFSIRLGKSMEAAPAPLIPGGVKIALTLDETGARALCSLTADEPGGLFEGRTILGLERDRDGVFRVTEWRRPQ